MTDLLPVVPCATCPWRKSSTAGGGDIPGSGRYWIPSVLASNLRRRFEDRYLSDTQDGLQ